MNDELMVRVPTAEDGDPWEAYQRYKYEQNPQWIKSLGKGFETVVLPLGLAVDWILNLDWIPDYLKQATPYIAAMAPMAGKKPSSRIHKTPTAMTRDVSSSRGQSRNAAATKTWDEVNSGNTYDNKGNVIYDNRGLRPYKRPEYTPFKAPNRRVGESEQAFMQRYVRAGNTWIGKTKRVNGPFKISEPLPRESKPAYIKRVVLEFKDFYRP